MTRILMKCPKCGEEYDLGINFCKRCESILEAVELEDTSISSSEKPSQESLRLPDEDNFERKAIKKKEEVKEIREEIQRSLVRAVIKELLLIKDEKKRYERLLYGLEEKRDKIPEEVYNESKANYENNLMEIAKRFKELKATYNGIREGIEEEIQSLEKKLIHLKEELYGLRRMSEAGLIFKKDRKIKEKALKEEINSKENNLREKRRLLNILSLKEKPESLDKRILVALVTGTLLLISAGYLLIKAPLKKPEQVPAQAVLPLREEADIEGVKKLLDKIKRANIEKDIELFESCYSKDYEGLNKRIENALALWRNFDFVHLEYILKDNIIKEKEGTIRIGWDMKVRSRDKGVVNEVKDDLTVFIIKEGDSWKIRRVIKEKT